MATLQNIRSKGPLLVIVIGIALFAFIAGDAWRIFQPNMGPRDAGEVNGDPISAFDYQQLLDEYTNVIKYTSGNSALTEEQLAQVKDEVWRGYVNNKLIENEAAKIGLTVTKEEIQAIIDEGTNPMLQQTIFRNPQTGAFDKDMLKKFLVDYAKMDLTQMPAQYVDYYRSTYNYWKFIEKNLVQSRLAEKYQNLLGNSFIANPIEAESAFNGRVNQYDMNLVGIPYSSIPDSIIKLRESDIQKVYDKRKEQYKQYTETRNIKYIDVHVTPSSEDRAETLEEVTDYANQLADATDMANFIRSTGSEYPYVDVFYSRTAFPADVTNRLDSVKLGEVYGPYFNQADNSFNAFKILDRQQMPDSVEYRQIQVYTEDVNRTKELADSIFNAIKKGADFVALARKYSPDGSEGQTTWISSQNYENAPLDADNTTYINTINNLKVKETANLSLAQGNIIVQVVNRKGMKDKFKVAVVKRTIEFSKETYNKVYNEFSQFIASNGTLQQMEANAEEAGYRLLERRDFYSSEHFIGGVKGTKEAIRWAFDAAKPGEVSPLYECGENDHLLVVALETVNKEGYRSLSSVRDQVLPEALREKKAEMILANLKGKSVNSFAQAKELADAKSDSIKHVSFSAPAYVSITRGSEPALGAHASIGEINKLQGPIKGNSGIYFMEVYNKETLGETYDQEKEMENLTNMNIRSISRFTNDLYLKANVKDNRFLFF